MKPTTLISIEGQDGFFIPLSTRSENGVEIIETRRYSKRCIECEQVLRLSAFGTDNTRLDKLNSRCRECINQIGQNRRDARRLIKAAEQIKRKSCQPVRRIWEMNLPAKDAVMRAIRAGANSQSEIKRSTKLTEDVLCDALAELYSEGQLDRASLKRRQYRMVA